MRRESAYAIVMTLRRPCHTCILQTRYKLVYTRAARSPHNLFLMLLMFLLSHHGCFHLAEGRNALGRAAWCHLQQEELGGGQVLAFGWAVCWWHCLPGVLSFMASTKLCSAGIRPCSPQVCCHAVGEGLQFLQRGGYGAEHQHTPLDVHGSLWLEGPDMREQMEQQQQRFPEHCWVAGREGGLTAPFCCHSSAGWAFPAVLPSCAKQRSCIVLRGSWCCFVLIPWSYSH